jgi:hypothetical protein
VWFRLMKGKHSGVDTWAHVQSEDGIDWRRLVSSIRRVEGNGAQGVTKGGGRQEQQKQQK